MSSVPYSKLEFKSNDIKLKLMYYPLGGALIMTIVEVEKYFGTLYRACRELGISPQNMTKWKDKGYIPLLQQYRIAELTEGVLMPDEDDPKVLNRKIRKKNKEAE